MVFQNNKKTHLIGLISAIGSVLLGCQTSSTKSLHTMSTTCDTLSGACALPASVEIQDTTISVPTITIDYFTDPICSSCWGFEPQLRRLKMEYGHSISIRYFMGGLLPDWSYNSGGISKPSDVYGHWREVAGYYEMPIDGSVWLNDPLHSSYPPSIAFKAAQMQDQHRAMLFLRRIREMVFIENKNIAQWPVLAAAAQEVGLDTAQLHVAFSGEARSAFESDLLHTRKSGVRGFPTLVIRFPEGRNEVIYGSKPYASIEKALMTGSAEIKAHSYDKSLSHLFTIYPTWTAKEVSIALGISFDQAEAQLREFVKQGLAKEITIVNGSIWRKI